MAAGGAGGGTKPPRLPGNRRDRWARPPPSGQRRPRPRSALRAEPGRLPPSRGAQPEPPFGAPLGGTAMAGAGVGAVEELLTRPLCRAQPGRKQGGEAAAVCLADSQLLGCSTFPHFPGKVSPAPSRRELNGSSLSSPSPAPFPVRVLRMCPHGAVAVPQRWLLHHVSRSVRCVPWAAALCRVSARAGDVAMAAKLVSSQCSAAILLFGPLTGSQVNQDYVNSVKPLHLSLRLCLLWSHVPLLFFMNLPQKIAANAHLRSGSPREFGGWQC